MNSLRRAPLLLLLLLLISSPELLAQTAIHGTVTDAQTGLPLSPATIQIQGTYHATITNGQGKFQLKVDTLPVTVLFSHIGYASHRISLTDTSGSEHHIRLAPIAYELEERVVTSRNTAEDIMRRVIKRKQTWWPAIKTLKVEAYTRFTTRNDTGIVSITESLSDAHWDHEMGWREIVKSKRQTANRRRSGYLPAAFFVTNFYDDDIRIAGHSLIGVTHPDALDVYRFALLGRRYLDEKVVYDISVTPRSNLQSAFSGKIAVLAGDDALLQISLKPNQSFRFPPPVRGADTSFEQQFNNFGESFWLPVDFQANLQIDIGILGLVFPTIHVTQISQLTDYQLNVSLPDSLYSRDRLVTVDSIAVQTDSLLSQAGATVPLSPEEATVYTTIDTQMTLAEAFQPKGFLARFVNLRENNRGQVESEERNRRRRRIPSIQFMPQIWYNRVDAAHLGLRLTARSRRHQRSRFTLNALGAYNTGIKRSAYGGSLELEIDRNRRNSILLSVQAYRGSETRYRSHIYPSPTYTSTLPLFGEQDYFDYFWNARLNLRSGAYIKSIGITAGLDLERHESLSKTSDYTLFRIDGIQRLNPAITPGKLRALSLKFAYADNNSAPGGLGGRRKAEFTVEFSHPRLMNSQFRYTRYELNLDWHFDTLFRRRFLPNTLDMRLTGSAATGVLPFQRFGILDASLNGTNTFGIFRSLFKNPYEGEKHFGVFWEHNFRTVPFEAVGLNSLVKRNISLILHGAHGRTWISKIRRIGIPYIPHLPNGFHHEIGFSISGIFDLARLDFTQRIDEPEFFLGIGLARIF